MLRKLLATQYWKSQAEWYHGMLPYLNEPELGKDALNMLAVKWNNI